MCVCERCIAEMGTIGEVHHGELNAYMPSSTKMLYV